MTTVSNHAELMSALSMAVGGDRIELTGGDYGVLSIRGVTFSSDVTIASADPAIPAIIHDLYLRDSSHLVFDGIFFDYVYVAGDKTWLEPFEVIDSAYITIRNSVFDGDEIPVAGQTGVYGTGFGLTVTGSNNVVVENNEFLKFMKALKITKSTNVVVSYNDVHTIRSDGFNFVSVDGVLIEGNWFRDFKTVDGDHPDMIQFWTKLGQMSSRNVIIRGNFFDIGTGNVTQSLFMRNGVVDTGQGSFAEYAYLNVLIENNVIYNAHIHGIMVGETDGLVVRNDTLLYDGTVEASSPGSGAPRVSLVAASLDVTVERNISEKIIDGDNLVVQRDDPNGGNYYGDLFVNALAGLGALADLRAVAGGVVELGLYGAEMTRADLPMLVGPSAEAPPSEPVPDMCEVLLANVEAQLIAIQGELSTITTLLNTTVAALIVAERELEAALVAVTEVEAELVAMTAERDSALQSESAALDDLEAAQTQLAVEVGKIAAILVIAGG